MNWPMEKLKYLTKMICFPQSPEKNITTCIFKIDMEVHETTLCCHTHLHISGMSLPNSDYWLEHCTVDDLYLLWDLIIVILPGG